METNVLDSLPDHIKAPENLELKQSTTSNGKSFGVFSVWPIANETQFGPYVGKIVPAEDAKGIERRYSWEVFDLDTMKLTHILDASNPLDGNWMRYVNCARFFEEQNLVSIQNGQDIFYKAIKDIEPGEELLTWYKPKRGRKRKSTIDLQDQYVKESLSHTESPRPKETQVPLEVASPERSKRIRKPKIIPDAYEGSFLNPKRPKLLDDDIFEPLKPGQLRRRRKKIVLDPVASNIHENGNGAGIDKTESSNVSEIPEESGISESSKAQSPIELAEVNEIQSKGKLKRGRKKLVKTEPEEDTCKKEIRKRSPKDNSQTQSATSQLIEITNSVAWTFPDKGQEYVFQLENHMISHGPHGCVYTCDICHGIYKNKFSLKRHYLRNHINYRFLSKSDIVNCLINLQQVIEAENDNTEHVRTDKRKTSSNSEDSETYLQNDDDFTIKSELRLGHDKNFENTPVTDDVTTTIVIENDEIVGTATKRKPAENGLVDTKLVVVNEKDINQLNGNANEATLKSSNDNSTCSEIFEDEKKALKSTSKKENDNNSTNNKSNGIDNVEEKNVDSLDDSSEELEQKKAQRGGLLENGYTKNTVNLEDESITTNGDKTGMKSETEMCQVTKRKGIYRCYTCKEIFDSLQDIKEHTLGHSDKDSANMPYKCDKCSMRFYFKQNLVRHSASHIVTEKRVPVNKEAAGASSHAIRDEDIPRNHECATCHKKFENLEKLKNHQVKHKKDWAKKKFPCQYCGKDFLSITNMKKHVRFHLGYRITCRYCPEVFSNVGALRKHTRISHPDIYKAKQLDKIARHGVLRRPDKKSWNNQEESEVIKTSKEDKIKVDKKKNSKEKISQAEPAVKPDIEEVSEAQEKDYQFDHGLSFAADEIDDGGSRFKFSCTVCKKRFSNYINMCRHRRKVHSNESKPKVDEPVFKLNPKKSQPVIETPEEVALFYASVSHNIATNLNEYIDGTPESLQNFRDHIKVEDYIPVSVESKKEDYKEDLTWEMYNFPPNFKPGKTISFSDIRKEFDIHSDFDSHCKSFLSDSESHSEELSHKESKQKVSTHMNKLSSNQLSANLDEINSIESGCKSSENINDIKATDELVVNNTVGAEAIESSKELLIKDSSGDCSNMDLTAIKANSLLKRQIETSNLGYASPCTLGFKHIENGEYTNFDDLLIGDMEIPLVPRSQSISSSVSRGKVETSKSAANLKTSESVDPPLPNNEIEKQEAHGFSVEEMKRNPRPLSLLCENLLGLKRKGINKDQFSKAENSSSSSLDSRSSSNESFHNGSILTTLSLAASQKDEERFQSTNQIFRDIKADYSESPNHTFDNYHDIAFGKNGQVASVCAICKKHFRDFDTLVRHHWKKHPASVCHFIEIEQGHEIDSLHFSEPSTVGALAVTDPGLENVFDREIFTCTRCGTSFTTLAKLHVHIVSCAPVDTARGVTKEEKHPKTPIKKKLQKKIKNIFNGGNSFKFKIKDFAGYECEKESVELKSHNVISGFRKKAESVVLPESPIKLIRKRSQDSVGYNPQKHVRRRELTDLVDTHQCEACGVKFKTIILLERHVPNCSKKEKFKDICPMKCPIMDESLAKIKHICHYCGKNFTYLKSLVNHLHDFCGVKKQKIDENAITEIDRVNEKEIMDKFQKHEEEKVMKGELKIEDPGTKRKGWQKGVKRKPKKKGHSWTLIKKRKPNSDVNEDDIDSGVEDHDENETSSGSNVKTHDNEGIEQKNVSYLDDKTSLEENSEKASHLKDRLSKIADTDMTLCSEKGNFASDMEKADIIESIDEVDSAGDISVQSKISCLTEFIGDRIVNNLNLEFESENQPCDSVKQSETSDMLSSSKIIFPKPSHFTEDKLLSKAIPERENIVLVNDKSKVKNTDLVEIDSSIEIEKKYLHSQEVKHPNFANSKGISSKPKEMEMKVSKSEKTKSLLFQCVTPKSRVKQSNRLVNFKEKKKDPAWQKLTSSLKKKLTCSKGKHVFYNEKLKRSVFRYSPKESHKVIELRTLRTYKNSGTCVQTITAIPMEEQKTEDYKQDKKNEYKLSEEESRLLQNENIHRLVENSDSLLPQPEKQTGRESEYDHSNPINSKENGCSYIPEAASSNRLPDGKVMAASCHNPQNVFQIKIDKIFPFSQVTSNSQVDTQCHTASVFVSDQNNANEIINTGTENFVAVRENIECRSHIDNATEYEPGVSIYEQIKKKSDELEHAGKEMEYLNQTEDSISHIKAESQNISEVEGEITDPMESKEMNSSCSSNISQTTEVVNTSPTASTLLDRSSVNDIKDTVRENDTTNILFNSSSAENIKQLNNVTDSHSESKESAKEELTSSLALSVDSELKDFEHTEKERNYSDQMEDQIGHKKTDSNLNISYCNEDEFCGETKDSYSVCSSDIVLQSIKKETPEQTEKDRENEETLEQTEKDRENEETQEQTEKDRENEETQEQTEKDRENEETPEQTEKDRTNDETPEQTEKDRENGYLKRSVSFKEEHLLKNGNSLAIKDRDISDDSSQNKIVDCNNMQSRKQTELEKEQFTNFNDLGTVEEKKDLQHGEELEKHELIAVLKHKALTKEIINCASEENNSCKVEANEKEQAEVEELERHTTGDNATVISCQNGENTAMKQQPTEGVIADIAECDMVYESVSEKVKKRKRNASGRQFYEPGFFQTKNISVIVKTTIVEDKKNNINCTNDKLNKSPNPKAPHRHSALNPKKSVERVENIKDTKSKAIGKHKLVMSNAKRDLQTKGSINLKGSKIVTSPKKAGKFSTSPRYMKKNSTSKDIKSKKEKHKSPPRIEEPYQIVLSPSERVKMNKRHCKRETYDFGLPCVKRISNDDKRATKILTDTLSKKDEVLHNTRFSAEINNGKSKDIKTDKNKEKSIFSARINESSACSKVSSGIHTHKSKSGKIPPDISRKPTVMRKPGAKSQIRDILPKSGAAEVEKKRGRPKQK